MLPMQFYPLKFEPIFKQRIWGGQKLRKVFNKNIQPLEKIGESWELADLPDDKSVILNGWLAGQTISEAVEKYPEQITGDAEFSGPFPLLIKFLDAEDILSVQVHPDKKTCRKMGTGQPKTECWYVISAEPGAVIYKGLKKHVTRQRFAEAVRNKITAELLNKIPVKPGQCHFLPAGTIHAIGAGLLLAEIQTPSDTTYRVFDWNRSDENGQPRQLHIDKAVESIHFDTADDELTVTTAGRLADCEYFRIDKNRRAENSQLPLSPDGMKVLVIITGSGTISSGKSCETSFGAGDILLVPAVCSGTMRFTEKTEYLSIML